MKQANTHISYCTNIHPGLSWTEHLQELKSHVPKIKEALSPKEPFGLGLRISSNASLELLRDDAMNDFKAWLKENDIYIFTVNGFPYADFHQQPVKEKVHAPDWASVDRKDYTVRLIKILSDLVPQGTEAGISTSPLGYRFGFEDISEGANTLKNRVFATTQIVEIASILYQNEKDSEKYLHLDIEPEPDGVLENFEEFIDWYQHELLPSAYLLFAERYGLEEYQIKKIVNRYITLCYDVCHFALEYEAHQDVVHKLEDLGIHIGKFQISSALKVELNNNLIEREEQRKILSEFDEPIYLHQVIARTTDNKLIKYRDLNDALPDIIDLNHQQWRSHFHVPIFLENYGEVGSTQQDIIEVLRLQNEKPRTNHIEVETYTWGVLPKDLRLPIEESICRELSWLLNELKS